MSTVNSRTGTLRRLAKLAIILFSLNFMHQVYAWGFLAALGKYAAEVFLGVAMMVDTTYKINLSNTAPTLNVSNNEVAKSNRLEQRTNIETASTGGVWSKIWKWLSTPLADTFITHSGSSDTNKSVSSSENSNNLAPANNDSNNNANAGNDSSQDDSNLNNANSGNQQQLQTTSSSGINTLRTRPSTGTLICSFYNYAPSDNVVEEEDFYTIEKPVNFKCLDYNYTSGTCIKPDYVLWYQLKSYCVDGMEGILYDGDIDPIYRVARISFKYNSSDETYEIVDNYPTLEDFSKNEQTTLLGFSDLLFDFWLSSDTETPKYKQFSFDYSRMHKDSIFVNGLNFNEGKKSIPEFYDVQQYIVENELQHINLQYRASTSKFITRYANQSGFGLFGGVYSGYFSPNQLDMLLSGINNVTHEVNIKKDGSIRLTTTWRDIEMTLRSENNTSLPALKQTYYISLLQHSPNMISEAFKDNYRLNKVRLSLAKDRSHSGIYKLLLNIFKREYTYNPHLYIMIRELRKRRGRFTQQINAAPKGEIPKSIKKVIATGIGIGVTGIGVGGYKIIKNNNSESKEEKN